MNKAELKEAICSEMNDVLDDTLGIYGMFFLSDKMLDRIYEDVTEAFSEMIKEKGSKNPIEHLNFCAYLSDRDFLVYCEFDDEEEEIDRPYYEIVEEEDRLWTLIPYHER